MDDIRLVTGPTRPLEAAPEADAAHENPELARIAAKLKANAEQQDGNTRGNRLVRWQGITRADRLAHVAHKLHGDPLPLTSFPGYKVD